MITTITFIGANSATEHLLGKTFAAEILCLGKDGEDQMYNMHLLKFDDKDYLLDIKEARVYDNVILFGILQDGGKVGRVAIQLN
jgi:hypothetical protein